MATQQNLQQLKDDIKDTLWNGTLADHQDVADQLMVYLTSPAGQDLARSSAQQYDQLVKQWVLLSFGAFIILPQDEQQDLLRTRLLVAIQAGYNVADFTAAYFDMYETDEFVAQIFGGFASVLQQNTETLGTTSLDIGGTKYLPQVRYWVLDYAKSPSQSARRTSIDRLNYVNASQNARQLTQVQRSQLLDILKLYDALNAVERPASTSQNDRGERAFSAPVSAPDAAVPARQQAVTQQDSPELSASSVDEIQSALEASLIVQQRQQQVQAASVAPKPFVPPVPIQTSPPRQPQPAMPQQKDLPRGLPMNEKDLPPPRPQQPVPSLEAVAKSVVAAHVEAPKPKVPQPAPPAPVVPPQPKTVQLSPSSAARIGSTLAASLAEVQGQKVQAPPVPKAQVSSTPPPRPPVPPPVQPDDQAKTRMAKPHLADYSAELVAKNLTAHLAQPEDFAKLSPADFHYTHPDKVFAALLQRITELSKTQQAWMIIESLEASPLYQAYIDSGKLLLNDEAADASKYEMSKEEFEAFADFRKSLYSVG